MSRQRLTTLAFVALVLAGVALAGWLGATAEDDPPLSPTSTQSQGLRALLDVLEELGAEVVVDDAPPEEADALLLLVDDLDDGAREEVTELVRGGTTLLLTDPQSPLAPEADAELVPGGGGFQPDLEARCDLPALESIERVRSGGPELQPPSGATGCFPLEEGYWLVATPEGEGHVVTVGTPFWLTNGELDVVDHAPLATALLLPADGAVVGVLPPDLGAASGTGYGVEGLVALVPGAVWALLAQLAVAAVIVVAWRARRLGRPVEEPQPVDVPGSDLVIAVGDLLQVTGSAAHASRSIREDARRELGARLGLGRDPEPGALVAAAVEAGADPERARRVLTGPEAADEAELVVLARESEALREEIGAERVVSAV